MSTLILVTVGYLLSPTIALLAVAIVVLVATLGGTR